MNNLNERVKKMENVMLELLKTYQENELDTEIKLKKNDDAIGKMVQVVSTIVKNQNELELNSQNATMISEMQDLKKEITSFKKEITDLKKINEQVQTRCSELEEKVFILVNDQDGKYNAYKKIAKSRVYKIVGGVETCENILFYRKFLAKLHNDVSGCLNVSNTRNIRIQDAEAANVIANRWRPDRKFVNQKLEEYRKLHDTNKLKGIKLDAYMEYLDKTNGGKKIEF